MEDLILIRKLYRTSQIFLRLEMMTCTMIANQIATPTATKYFQALLM